MDNGEERAPKNNVVVCNEILLIVNEFLLMSCQFKGNLSNVLYMMGMVGMVRMASSFQTFVHHESSLIQQIAMTKSISSIGLVPGEYSTPCTDTVQPCLH